MGWESGQLWCDQIAPTLTLNSIDRTTAVTLLLPNPPLTAAAFTPQSKSELKDAVEQCWVPSLETSDSDGSIRRLALTQHLGSAVGTHDPQSTPRV